MRFGRPPGGPRRPHRPTHRGASMPSKFSNIHKSQREGEKERGRERARENSTGFVAHAFGRPLPMARGCAEKRRARETSPRDVGHSWSPLCRGPGRMVCSAASVAWAWARGPRRSSRDSLRPGNFCPVEGVERSGVKVRIALNC